MEVKVRNFTKEFNDLKKQSELNKTIENMAYSYIQIKENNPLVDIAKYINSVLNPIVELKFSNDESCGWIPIRNNLNNNFLYTDVIIKNLTIYNNQGVQRIIIRDIDSGKAKNILVVDVWKNGYEIVERTNSPELISHLCYDWKNIKPQIDKTIDNKINIRNKELSKNNNSILYCVEMIRKFEV